MLFNEYIGYVRRK